MMKRFLGATLIFLFSLSAASAQIVFAPVLHCVSLIMSPPGAILLSWSDPVNSCGSFNAYYIYRSTSFNGPYSLIHTELSQSATSYVDAVGNGNSVTYYYYMVSDFSCPGGTFLHSDTIDNLDPVPPQINFVTVNNNAADISWNASISPETFGYILYRVVNGSNIPIDTVYGKNNTFYTDVNAPVNTDSASYTLAAIDSCLNTGPINVMPQHTLFLDKTVDRCTQTISLTWYAYSHWQSPVQQYDIYTSVNGAPFALIQTVAATTLSYDISGFSDGDSVSVKVIATESVTLFTSTSNNSDTKLNLVEPGRDLYVRKVSVSAPDHIEVYYSVDSLADLLSIRIERGLDGQSFSSLASIFPPADLSVTNIFIDSSALTATLSYYYRVIATDSCNQHDTSNIGKSVLLTGYAFSDLSFYLKWDESYMQYGTVAGYELYRDDGNGFNKVTDFPSSTFEYGEANLPTTTPCYYVEAIDSMIFPNGMIDTIHSRSNVLCLNQPSQIYMPNAFAPEGKNNIFKPILNFTGINSYSFSVYNRWGGKIFTTVNENDGWDGTYNGNIVQQGAYAYQVIVVDETKTRYEARGTVLVVR